jgi:hypothetical protein
MSRIHGAILRTVMPALNREGVATMMMIKKLMTSNQPYLRWKAKVMKGGPSTTATVLILWIDRFVSRASEVSSPFPTLTVRLATCPIIVLSSAWATMHPAVPTTREKNKEPV